MAAEEPRRDEENARENQSAWDEDLTHHGGGETTGCSQPVRQLSGRQQHDECRKERQRRQDAVLGHVEAENVEVEQRKAVEYRVVAPAVRELGQAARQHRAGREYSAPGRPRLLDVSSTDERVQVFAFGGRYARMCVRRVVTEYKPGKRPDAADRTENVEDGGPSAGEAVVAQHTAE